MKGYLKGWYGDLDVLKHLDAHGVLDQAAKDMDSDEEIESISGDDFMAQLRERYK